jgi:transcriptional regulator
VNEREIGKRSIERALKALALRRQGLTFREIGKQIGTHGPVTTETARQAVKKGERVERLLLRRIKK